MKTSYSLLILSIFFMLACSLTSSPVSSNADVKVNNVYLATPSSSPSPIPSTIPTACTVSAQSLNLRSCGGLHCPVIAWLSKDDALVVQEVDQDWLKVTTQVGQTGWVHSKYCGGRQ